MNQNEHPYESYFSAKHLQHIKFLNRQESEKHFVAFFGPKFRSFFDFPDTHWAVQRGIEADVNWRERFNESDLSSTRIYLQQNVEWDDRDDIYFCAKAGVVIRAPWDIFLQALDDFLGCEDDGVFVVNPKQYTAVFFATRGQIRLLNRPTHM